MSKGKLKKKYVGAKDCMCALYLKTYNNLFSAAFEQNLNENSWESKTGVFEPVGECERHLTRQVAIYRMHAKG